MARNDARSARKSEPQLERRDVDTRTGVGHREEIPDVAPDGIGGARPGASDPTGIGRR